MLEKGETEMSLLFAVIYYTAHVCTCIYTCIAPDKVSKMNFNLLYLCYFSTKCSQWDDSNKWANIEFDEENDYDRKKYTC